MARKKRQVPEQFKAPVQTADKPKTVYQDEFQSGVNKRVEDFGRKFEGKGRNVLYGLAALAVLAVLIGIFFAWNRRSDAAAQAALGVLVVLVAIFFAWNRRSEAAAQTALGKAI